MSDQTNLRALLGDRYADVIDKAMAGCARRGSKFYATRQYTIRDRVADTLAAVLPDLLATAWDWGHGAGWDDCQVRLDVPDLTNTPNPYRTEETATHCDRGPCHLPAGHGGPCNPGGDADR